MPKYQHREDDLEGEELLRRQAWNTYQGESGTRAEARERRAIILALREADKRRAKEQPADSMPDSGA